MVLQKKKFSDVAQGGHFQFVHDGHWCIKTAGITDTNGNVWNAIQLDGNFRIFSNDDPVIYAEDAEIVL